MKTGRLARYIATLLNPMAGPTIIVTSARRRASHCDAALKDAPAVPIMSILPTSWVYRSQGNSQGVPDGYLEFCCIMTPVHRIQHFSAMPNVPNEQVAAYY